MFIPNMFTNRVLSPMERMRPVMKLQKDKKLKNSNKNEWNKNYQITTEELEIIG